MSQVFYMSKNPHCDQQESALKRSKERPSGDTGVRMQRAIKSTCSHCQREIYFDPCVIASFDALSELDAASAGTSARFSVNMEAPPDVVVLDQLPHRDDQRTGAIGLTG